MVSARGQKTASHVTVESARYAYLRRVVKIDNEAEKSNFEVPHAMFKISSLLMLLLLLLLLLQLLVIVTM